MTEYIVRFLIGGFAVSVFAAIGDVLRPKSFAGLFGAAPSIALVTLSIALGEHGSEYVATESRSMMIGSLALATYSWVTCQLMMRVKQPALAATAVALLVWLAFALGLQRLLLEP
jgi:Protein of unknown function (DUF3147)